MQQRGHGLVVGAAGGCAVLFADAVQCKPIPRIYASVNAHIKGGFAVCVIARAENSNGCVCRWRRGYVAGYVENGQNTR